MSKISSVLPSNDTVKQGFKALETETAALFEHLDLSFLTTYPVFAPDIVLREERDHSFFQMLRSYVDHSRGERNLPTEFTFTTLCDWIRHILEEE